MRDDGFCGGGDVQHFNAAVELVDSLNLQDHAISVALHHLHREGSDGLRVVRHILRSHRDIERCGVPQVAVDSASSSIERKRLWESLAVERKVRIPRRQGHDVNRLVLVKEAIGGFVGECIVERGMRGDE